MILLLTVDCLFAKDLKRAITSFIIFGLFMTLAYVRLNAPDVALTEAAVGSGVTGALLIKVYTILKRQGQKQ